MNSQEVIDNLLSSLRGAASYIEVGVIVSKTPKTDQKAVDAIKAKIKEIEEEIAKEHLK